MNPERVACHRRSAWRRAVAISRCAAPLAALLVALPAPAQYKVVEPDGRVTYTDRQPQASRGRVTSLGRHGVEASGDPALPLELRQPVARYPVTLYSLQGDCSPCDSARQLLQQRGVPYSEKLIQSAEDGEALQRLTGSRDAPVLAVGAQTLRGLAPGVWNSYLDAAGYPRESHLPAGYRSPPATPLTERRAAEAASAPRAADAVAATPPPAPPPAASGPPGIKF